MLLLGMSILPLVFAGVAFGQTAPTITNVKSAAIPATDLASNPVSLISGSAAVILGANLAGSTASAAPPWQPLLGGIEVHLVDDSCYDTSCELAAKLMYASPTQIDFVVPNIPNTSRVWKTRVVIVKDGQRFDGLTSPRILIDAIYFESYPNPSIYDQPVTFTAHVSVMQGVVGSPFNTIGAVTFMDGVTPLGVVTLSNVITFADMPPVRRYDVSFTTSRLAAGDHSIRADYSGDNSNKPGSSGVITQIVQTPEITIWSGPNPSTYGITVTLAATVSPSTCTGSVTFFDEWDQLGTAAIYAGRAFISTAALPVGNHPITVRYNGDGSCPPLVFGPANNFGYRATSQTVTP